MKNCKVFCFYLFNTITVLCGLLMLIAGILMQYLPAIRDVFLTTAPTVSESQIGVLAIGLIMVGAFIAFVSFVGFCGVATETACMLNLYIATMVLLLIGQIVIGAVSIVFGNKSFETQIDSNFRPMVLRYYQGSDSSRTIVDTVQQFLDCCGVQGPADYPSNKTTEGKDEKSKMIPKSCCSGETEGEISMCLNSTVPLDQKKEYIYQKGCTEEIQQFFNENSKRLAAVCFAVAFLVLLTIIFVCLYKRNHMD